MSTTAIVVISFSCGYLASTLVKLVIDALKYHENEWWWSIYDEEEE